LRSIFSSPLASSGAPARDVEEDGLRTLRHKPSLRASAPAPPSGEDQMRACAIPISVAALRAARSRISPAGLGLAELRLAVVGAIR